MASSEIAHKRAQTFIFEALHLDTHLPTAATAQQMQAEDWDYVLKIAGEHRLGAMLHNRLKRDDLASIIPEQILTYLKAAYRKSALRSLVVYRELAKVTQLLEAEGISSIALKGAYLARFAYPDPALRPMRDLDLLLKPEQALGAFELLKNYGYRPVSIGSPEAYLVDHEHFSPLIGSSGICIELHYRLNEPGQPYLCGSENEIWTRSLFKSVGSIEFKFFSPEDLLRHLCVHATIRHHFNLGALALVDVLYLIETHPIDWKLFLSTTPTGESQRCALALLHLAKKKLGARIPDEVIEALGGSCDGEAWLKSAEYLLFSTLADHGLLTDNVKIIIDSKRISRKFYALLGAIFPARHIIARDFPVQMDSMKVFGYYPLRWYRLFTKTLPLLLTAFLYQTKHSTRPLVKHYSIFNNWLHEKSPH